MKLIKCHIANFGKLSNLSINFAEGINVINEPNAWGKSTLAAFLKAMFYGLDAKKEAGAFEKERVFYRPWQGGAFGGELDFETNGKTYRISRTFGKTEKTDEFHLYDLQTNLESSDFSKDIGLELFDLDSASFKRSIFIAQNDCVSETSDRINAKLGNLAENTNDINNFETASRRMKEMMNQLTPDRVTGSIKKRKNLITQLKQELRAFESAQEGLEGIRRKEQLVTSQIKELLEIRNNYASALVVASEDSRRRELYAQYESMCRDVKEKEERFKALEACFPGGVPTSDEFQEQMQVLRNLEEKKATLRSLELSMEEHETWKQLQQMFEEEVPSESNIDFSIEMLASVETQKEEIARQEMKLLVLEDKLKEEVPVPNFGGNVSRKICYIVGGLLIILGGVMFGAWYSHAFSEEYSQIAMIAAFVVAAVGIVCMVTGTVLGSKAQKRKKAWEEKLAAEYEEIKSVQDDGQKKMDALKEGVNQIHDTIKTFLGKFHIDCEVPEYRSRLYQLKNQLREYHRLEARLTDCMLARENFEAVEKKVKDFAERYSLTITEEISADLQALQNKSVEYQHAASDYMESCAKRQIFEQRQEKNFWTKEAFCPYTLDELNTMIGQADAKLEELKAGKSQYEKQMEDLQEQLDLRDEKQAELDEQMAQQEYEMRKYTLIKTTHDFLQQAKKQLTARYMDPIAKGFAKYYGILTGSSSEDWVLDANIKLKIYEQGELRDTRWLSAGYQDLIGICMRLALVEAMYTEEKPFLILDDPFVSLDKEKVNYGNQLLLSVAEEYQIIYFTCHESRNPL